MADKLRIVALTDGGGAETAWLARAESVHRQLRPQLPPDYVGRMGEVLAKGAQLALVVDDDAVLCVAL